MSMGTGVGASLRQWARSLKRQTLVVYLLARDARTPWLVRLLALLVAAYALSPIDLIPDFIPVLGYLDDVILVPLGLALVLRLAPAPLLAEVRERAEALSDRPVSRTMALIVVLLWAALMLGFAAWVYARYG